MNLRFEPGAIGLLKVHPSTSLLYKGTSDDYRESLLLAQDS